MQGIEITTNSDEETRNFAKGLLKELKPGDILALEGDLGGGKTTFTQGLLSAIGIKEKITSPTFLIIKKYKLVRKKQFSEIFHIDFYRIEDSKETEYLGIQEIFEHKSALIIIEWADRVKNIIPKRAIWVKFKFVSENKRLITVK